MYKTYSIHILYDNLFHINLRPMYSSVCWEEDLSRSWRSALALAWPGPVATVLLGAGARGAPVPAAARVAAESIQRWSRTCSEGAQGL